MRENRTYGSEGGEGSGPFLPLSAPPAAFHAASRSNHSLNLASGAACARPGGWHSQ